MKKQEKKTGLKEILKGGQETLPGFQFQIYRAEDKRSLWNADFEILFLLKGDGRVSYEDGVVYRVQEKDLFVVNGFQICSIDLNEQGILLSLKIRECQRIFKAYLHRTPMEYLQWRRILAAADDLRNTNEFCPCRFWEQMV